MRSLGLPMGQWQAHTYTSAGAVLAGGLNTGALWILIEPGSARPTEAGIWPQVPGGGGGDGGAILPDTEFNPGPLVFVLTSNPLQGLVGSVAGPDSAGIVVVP